MFSSILSAFSGLLGFSKGLDVISNNVANLNTPGFKATELQFRDLFYRNGLGRGDGESDQIGEGVSTGSTRTKFNQGQFRDTTNPLDLAIDGNGFFMLRKDGDTFYTRNGQFEFNDDGILVEHGSQGHVVALNGGRLGEISITGLRVSPPQPTTEVSFTGNLSSGSTSHQITDVQVFDGAGVSHNLTINFTNNNTEASGSWKVEVQEGTNTVGSGEIRFEGAGSPQADFNSISFDFAPANTPQTTIVLKFGEPGSFSGATSFSAGTTSDLRVDKHDGFGIGSLVQSSFSETGALTLKYSNGQTTTHDQLAMALFENEQDLTPAGNDLFKAPVDKTPTVAAASEKGVGKIASSKVELSNVDLTEQFTDIVVIQRGFQASSQVISVANEMAQQLLDLRARR